jgi:hypothetical protein
VFTLLENRREVAQAQRRLEATIRGSFVGRATKNIGYPGGTKRDANVLTDGHYWFWSQDKKGLRTPNPRRLNWFGLFRQDSNLEITVEVNVAYEGRNNELAGFFARDTDTGAIHLLHSGRLGGGTAGVRKLTFLAWCFVEGNQQPVEVADSSGGMREGLLVMPVAGAAATRPAARYIDVVASFKRAVRAHAVNTPVLRRRQKELRDFYAEARGRRRSWRSGMIDYLSRHGDVIDALHAWRSSSPLPSGGRLVKNILLDLGVAVDGNLVEVFEAKTSVARSAIYGAIGQLMVHGAAEGCRRVLVLPAEERLAEDVVAAVNRLRIEVLRFSLDEKSVTIA